MPPLPDPRPVPPLPADHPLAAAAQALAAAVDAAINGIVGEASDAPLLACVFLLPVLLVTAGRALVAVRGVVPEKAAITRLMKNAGALGPVESFGLSNALAYPRSVAGIAPGLLFRSVRSLCEAAGADLLTPADLQVRSAEESVHLRFLAGASVTPAAMPTYFETVGQVGHASPRRR